MIRPFELLVGLRYTRARKRSHFISFISLISILGITLGIAALITVLSVMNGFGKELRGRILGVVSHVTVTGDDGRLRDWEGVARQAQKNPHVVGRAPYILGQGLVARGKNVSGVAVRGILPREEAQVAEFGARMTAGTLDDLRPDGFGIVVGSALAWKLDLAPGSQVSLVVPQAQATPAGLLPRFKRFTVVGVFRMDMYEYDSGLVLIHLDDAAKLYQTAGAVSGLRLKLDDLDRAPQVSEEIAAGLGAGFRARDWTREHGNFFRALKIEKTVMFVILLLIVTVAMFNVVSMLVVVVTEKESDIAILRTLGASPRSIMGIFMVQGAVVGVIGTLVGTFFGVLLALNVEGLVQLLERLFSMSFVAADVYFISELPSDLRWDDVAMVSGASLILGLLSTLYPAWRASQVQPAEALRYE
ncbi:MAG: cell division protein FtsX [Candidatus Muproteobacteria bacterium RBG_16_65_31]|uniref:Cell division protein FtsX n=1 Tax=Candidatus Muproteobacteria bacterium RBG_16_65_31 TaxID=1817759 RepID=A0A1F6TCJ2_9PROT|nr:MAG: cell division protein FtsX [Candidatus Muproteobacteria bacterium RBG_16_65_31]